MTESISLCARTGISWVFWNSDRQFSVAADHLDKLARFIPNSSDMKASIPPVLITFALVCFALVQNTQAVSPPPDGGYPGGNTAEGQNALLSLTSGTFNTAVGLYSLLSNAEGQFNTAIGAGALLADVGSQDAFYGSRNTAIGAAALLNNNYRLRQYRQRSFCASKQC